MSNNPKNTKHKRLSKKILKYILVCLLILMSYDVVMGGNIRFYGKWISCGQKPLTGKGSGYMNVGAPHYIESPTIDALRSYPDLFCTPIEAERAKYSADPNRYDFPYLREAGEGSPLLRDSEQDGRKLRDYYNQQDNR